MISDKDIIVELLRQREELQAKMRCNPAPDSMDKSERINELVDMVDSRDDEIGRLNKELADSESINESWAKLCKENEEEIERMRNASISDNVKNTAAWCDKDAEVERLKKENSRIYSDLDDALEERDRLKKERDELRALFEELDADDLRKMLNIPGGERLLVQIVPKVKALMLELANAKHVIAKLNALSEDRKTAYNELRYEYDKIQAKVWPTK